MRAFVSYARRDADAVKVLCDDLEELCGAAPWVDRALKGGQLWWDEILDQIRSADAFILAVSRTSLRSEACLSELRYALDTGRSVLPIMVADGDLDVGPSELRELQVVDYRERGTASALDLARAVMALKPCPPLSPEELPAPPAIPQSYAQPLRAQLSARSLDLEQQAQLFAAIKIHVGVEDDHEEALAMLRELRARRDITVSVAADVDALLATEQRAPADHDEPSTPTPTPTAPKPAGPKPADSAPPPPPVGAGLRVPVDELTRVLAPFRTERLKVLPDIPEQLVTAARSSLDIPPSETVVFLLDLAATLHGTNALVITDAAVHHRKWGTTTHIPFEELVAHPVSAGWAGQLRLGAGRSLGMGNSQVPAKKVAEIVIAVKHACTSQHRDG